MNHLLVWKARIAAADTMAEFDAALATVSREHASLKRCPAELDDGTLTFRCTEDREPAHEHHNGNFGGIIRCSFHDSQRTDAEAPPAPAPAPVAGPGALASLAETEIPTSEEDA